MSTRKNYLYATTVAALSLMLLFSGCSKPPTEEVAALEACKAQGAEVFAEAEYGQAMQKMSTLQGYMDSKQNRMAKALADSMMAEMEALKSATATNAKDMSTQAVTMINEELAKLKGMMTPEAAKMLGAEEAGKCEQQVMEMDSKAAALKADLDNSAFLDAFNNAKPLMNDIAMASQDMNQKMEQAKAMAAEKMAKAKKPAKKK